MSYYIQLVLFLSRPRVLLVLIGLYLAFLFGVMPLLMGVGEGVPPIDLAFHYSVEEVYGWIAAYGEEGRRRYMLGEMTFDVAYPLIYTSLFIGLIGYLIDFQTLVNRPADEGRSPMVWLVVLPVSIWLFDMLENIGIVTMLANFPEVLAPVAKLTAWATTIKWSLAYLVIALTLLLGLKKLVATFTSK